MISYTILSDKGTVILMKKVMCVFGTRPEAIKMSLLVFALKKYSDIETVTCVSGQHRELLTNTLASFGLHPEYNLNIMKEHQDPFDITINILKEIKAVLEKEKPDIVLVHGDTSTAFITSLACFYLRIPVGHVEAGLRTYDLHAPFPEEMNRQGIDIIADYYYAPTEIARQNLISEGKKSDNIIITGNTAIDVLGTTVSDSFTHPILEWAGKDTRLIVLTVHRRENLGGPMREIFEGIRMLAEAYPDVRIVYPMHPNVKAVAQECLGECSQVYLSDPLDVIPFHNIMSRSYFILTDSGGIQEEASFLEKPVLVLRDATERPENLKYGVSKLVGTDKTSLLRESGKLLDDPEAYKAMTGHPHIYGDGHASERIAAHIHDVFYGKE